MIKKQMSKQLLNELRFKTPAELLQYRQIHVDAITGYENIIDLSDEYAAALVRHKQYLTIVDMLLNDAFLGTVKDRLISGINIDPVLFPGINVPEFLQATKMLGVSSTDTQQQLEFKEIPVDEPISIVPIAAVNPTASQGMTAEQAIKAIFKGLKKPELLTIIQAAKVHCYKVRNLDPEKLPLNDVLKAFLEDKEYEFVNKFGTLNFCGCWMLSLLRQHRNPVAGMLQLKSKFFDANPEQVGQLYQFMTEYAFNRNQVDGKYQGVTWGEYGAMMDNPFRIAINREDVDLDKEKIEKETYQGEIIAMNKSVKREIFSNPDVARFYLAYAASIKDEEKRKLFIVGDKVRPDTFARTIEECVSYGSPLKRTSIEERRIKQMTGESPQKEYKEGSESGYKRH